MSHASQNPTFRRWLGWSIGVIWCIASFASAQQPQQPRPTPKPAAKPAPKPPTAEELALAAERTRIKGVEDEIRKKLQGKISNLQRTGQINDQDKPDVEEYVDRWIDILSSPGGALEVPDARQQLRRNVRAFGQPNDGKEKPALAHINQLLLSKLEAAAFSDKYPPHGRYNCMLALGELNEVEPSNVGAGPVKPMPQALPVLHKAVAQADMLPAVKVAALIGMQRHTKFPVADKNVERTLATDLAKLVQQSTLPADISADGHQWMRRQAIDVLMNLKQPGPASEVVTALTTTVADKNNSMWVRLDAARALGQFKLPANALGEDIAETIGRLTLDLLKNETNLRALRLGLQGLDIGMKGQGDQTGIMASLSGPGRKRADELNKRIGLYAKVVEKVDPSRAAEALAQMQIDAADLEAWITGEDPNAAVAQ
jgi:hypothetical protein